MNKPVHPDPPPDSEWHIFACTYIYSDGREITTLIGGTDAIDAASHLLRSVPHFGKLYVDIRECSPVSTLDLITVVTP